MATRHGQNWHGHWVPYPHHPLCEMGLRPEYVILIQPNVSNFPVFPKPPTPFSKPLLKNFLYPIKELSVNNLRIYMRIHIEPDIGVPIDNAPDLADLPLVTAGAAETAKLLSEHGLDIEVTSEDKDLAAKLATSYAQDSDTTSRNATPARVSKLTPATLLLTDKILKDFGHSVVESSVQLRHLVTNKLVEETENPDARIRIKALELLGKISDVGLFAEKSEVTITHQTTDDLKERLRIKLSKLVNPEPEIEDAIILTAELMDLSSEFGFDDD